MAAKKNRQPEEPEETRATEAPETDPQGDESSDEPLSLEDQVRALTARCEDLNARALRAQADYQNLRRRAQQDLETSLQRNVQPLLDELLYVLDFLDMALASPATNEETKNLVLGVQMTRTKFVQALENADVKAIPTEGLFDPSLHEATEARPAPEAEPGTILSVVRRGYTWQDRVLRHAQVIVAQGDTPAAEAEEPGDEAGANHEAENTAGNTTGA